ncbi:unnamed protein product, partial [Laminaria digitata]
SGALAGDLCAALRCYCDLVALARPPLGPQRLQAALFAPLDALEAALVTTGTSSSSSSSPRSSLAAVARLEEVVMCSILVTAGRVGAGAGAGASVGGDGDVAGAR